jgi:hypothetical protein
MWGMDIFLTEAFLMVRIFPYTVKKRVFEGIRIP